MEKDFNILKKLQIEKFLQNGATAPREERAASCHEGGQSDREGGEYAFVGMMTLMLMMMAMMMMMKNTRFWSAHTPVIFCLLLQQ